MIFTKKKNAYFAYQNFMKMIRGSFNECFPIISSTRKYSQAFSKPWLTVDF